MLGSRLFARRVQARNCRCNDIKDLLRTGSWIVCIVATIAAFALIFSAGAQNVAHGYQLGLASSEFRALVLAAASVGASVLGPFCWVAVVRGRGFGTRIIALVLAPGGLAYASVCSLGFVAGSRDAAISERASSIDAHQDRRALVKAARDELAGLKGQRPEIAERRAELTALLAKLGDATPVKSTAARPDSQAAGVAFVLGAFGWRVAEGDVGQWLNILTVGFLELAAALSLTVAAALYPATRQDAHRSPPEAALPDPAPDSPKPETGTRRPNLGP